MSAHQELVRLDEDASDSVKWAAPLYPKKKVRLAGRIAIEAEPERADMSWSDAVDIVANWRASHGWPLQAIAATLRNRAEKVDSRAIVAQRSKRLRSVASKLRRNPTMDLSQMQDLGVCRAIVRSVAEVRKLVEHYHSVPPATAVLK